MAKNRDYHVIPSPNGGWSVRREGAERATSVFHRKSDAMEYGRRLARRSQTELIEQGRDGRIRDSASHGGQFRSTKSTNRDTARPKGYGSLGGKFTVREGVDITKPIYEQTRRKTKANGDRMR